MQYMSTLYTYIYKHTEISLTEGNSFLISSKDTGTVLLMSHCYFYFVTLLIKPISKISTVRNILGYRWPCFSKKVGQEVPHNLNHSVIL